MRTLRIWMPRYYFHLSMNSTDIIDVDTYGVELADDEAAKAEAMKAIGEMLRDAALQPGEHTLDQTLVIVDETGSRGPYLTHHEAERSDLRCG